MADPTDPASGAGSRPLSDHSLLLEVRDGNEQAAASLYLRYAPRLRDLARARCSADLARRLDAEDIVQAVFSSCFHGFSRGRYDVPAGTELWKLLVVMALNEIRANGNHHRAAKRDVRLTVGGTNLDALPRAACEPDRTPLAFLQLALDEVLERLPGPRRQVVALRIEGHEVAAIAERVGLSKRTVERVLHDFRRQMARALELGQED